MEAYKIAGGLNTSARPAKKMSHILAGAPYMRDVWHLKLYKKEVLLNGYLQAYKL